MSAEKPHPGDAYPEECRQWMERTMERAAVGDIPGCMEMQQRANDCLRAHGMPAQDLPEAYFMLMHESLGAAMDGDKVGARLIGERMNEMLIALGIEDPEPEIEWPAECLAIESQIEAAEAAGDFLRGLELLQEYDQCLKRHNMPSPDLPERWYELQRQMYYAQQRGDQTEVQRIQRLCEQMQQAAGLEI